MTSNSSKRLFIMNLIYAFGAQTVSLLSSFLVSFLVPKVLGVVEFGYWQLFLFYVSYVNISRLGLIDGMYLKLGGKKRNEIEVSTLKTEWMIFVIFQIVVAICIGCFFGLLVDDLDRLFVIVWCSICLVVINSNNYLGFIFQAINETKIYSISEIIYNILWFVAVFFVCVFKGSSYKIIIVMYTLGQILAGVYLMNEARFILKSKQAKWRVAIRDAFDNIKIGFSLLIAFYASMLIIGSARFIIDGKWGIEVFGVFSFSLSLATFVLKFIRQVSMVLFPALRQLNKDDQNLVYTLSNKGLSLLLPAVLLGFMPISIVVSWWLPQYSDSMFFLAILLPICVFDGKMQLLYSTYLKVLRKERQLLYVNIIATVVSFGLSFISVFLLNNLNGVAIAIVIAIAMRSIISEILLSKSMNCTIDIRLLLLEVVLITFFIYTAEQFSTMISFLLYLIAYCIYIFINKQSLRLLLTYFQGMRKTKFDVNVHR